MKIEKLSITCFVVAAAFILGLWCIWLCWAPQFVDRIAAYTLKSQAVTVGD
jgi:hypothetical protein